MAFFSFQGRGWELIFTVLAINAYIKHIDARTFCRISCAIFTYRSSGLSDRMRIGFNYINNRKFYPRLFPINESILSIHCILASLLAVPFPLFPLALSLFYCFGCWYFIYKSYQINSNLLWKPMLATKNLLKLENSQLKVWEAGDGRSLSSRKSLKEHRNMV